MSDAPSQRQPFAAGALDGAVVAFAAFTLVANALVALGRSLDELLVVCAAALTAAFAGALAMRRRGRGAVGDERTRAPNPLHGGDESATQSRGLRGALLGGAAVAAVAGAATGSIVAWWGCALATFCAAVFGEARAAVTAPPPTRTRAADWMLVALGVLLATAVAVAHRADADDSFYVNLIVAAIDHPGASLLGGDTLHGYAGVPMALPVFKVVSWEILQAGAARIVGVDGLTLAHRVVPPLIALLVPLAWARLAMRLLPGSWPLAVAFVVIGFVVIGDGRAAHGDFGVLRLHQGKAVLLHVALPLCAAYAIEYGLAPSRAGFVRLAAIQVAAVGLSASGLWLGPVAAGLALLAVTPLRPTERVAGAKRLAIGVTASAYPVVLALSLRAATLQAMQDAPSPLEGAAWDGPRLMEHATDLVLGAGPYRWLALFSLLAATASSGAPMMRRFAAVSGASFVAVLFDPLTAPFLANSVTGADTYFRVFWALPVPLFVAAVLTEPLRMTLPGRLDGARTRAAVTVATAAFVLAFAPRVFTLSVQNDARLGAPGIKLPPLELAAARSIAAHAGANEFVLAPLSVARWVPLVQGYPSPLMVREMYLDRLHTRLGSEELDRRRVLAHFVGGRVRPPGAAGLLAESIHRYPLAVVCVAGPALGWPELRRVLRDSPLVVVERTADHEIWARPGTPGD